MEPLTAYASYSNKEGALVIWIMYMETVYAGVTPPEVVLSY